MGLFILLYLVVYGGMNVYVYFTIAAGLGYQSATIAIGLVCLVLAPIIVRVAERRVSNRISNGVSFLGFNWMGIAFIFVSFSGIMDLLQVFVSAFGNSEALAVVTGLTLVASLYAFYEMRHPRTQKILVQSPKVGYDKSEPFRLVQISDLHLGIGSSLGHIKKVLNTIRSLEPDLLVSTGDLFDSNLEQLQGFVELFRDFHPVKGKLAVTGNHEMYAGIAEALKLTGEAGFNVLSSSAVQIDDFLWVAGVDDPEVPQSMATEDAERNALGGVPSTAFLVLLKHRPHISSVTSGIDLQLSGHTHGGQIFPFIFLTRLQYKVRHGLTQLSENTYLYLSRGTGAWGPQLRFLAPPEITVFDFVKGDKFSVSVG